MTTYEILLIIGSILFWGTAILVAWLVNRKIKEDEYDKEVGFAFVLGVVVASIWGD